jgi:hypothetical protein
LAEGTILAKLKDITLFRKFAIEYGTVVWKTEELDIAPETLYTEATGKQIKYHLERNIASSR